MQCMFPEHLVQYIRPPTFGINSGTDSWELGHTIWPDQPVDIIKPDEDTKEQLKVIIK